MKLQFSATEHYQWQAVRSVVNIFEGQLPESSTVISEKGIGNQLILNEAQIMENIQAIQAQNGIVVGGSKKDFKAKPSLMPKSSPLHFTVEMETGTGKTYTFLRTAYELNKVYGFKKFVIVVPSVAIREGTLKNLAITHAHFQNLYENPPLNYIVYERNNLTSLRNFATSNEMQILVINVDSFTKDNNIINTIRETGARPIEYVQATKPIVIIDEPQNFETDIRKQAIANLNPLCTLRYSATHKNLYHLVYSLNPVQAYDLGLVKQIEVDGISSDTNHNVAFVYLKKIILGKKILKANIAIYAHESGSVKQKDLTVNLGDDLFVLSNQRAIYKEGYLLNSINAAERTITFSNGIVISEGEAQGGLRDEIMKFQIERTVKWHFGKVKNLKEKGIKVLSLFFIDRVTNYRMYDNEGNFGKGKFALWFEESFKKYQSESPDLIPFEASQVHNGYFSSDKKNIWVDSKEKNTQKDDDTYTLIMREKERLLSITEPLQFIFSHSALREGWDNPNVFQICTLNESKSDLKKRQEIGRGLRLPVDSEGQRVKDKNINILTVIANETYEDFSRALQNEIQEETSVDFTGRLTNARGKVNHLFPKALNSENLLKKHCYISFDNQELVSRAVEEIRKMPISQRPMLASRTARLAFSAKNIEEILTDESTESTQEIQYQIPDVYAYIQSKIDISRHTIYQILIQSDRYSELAINPQLFLDTVIVCIKKVLQGFSDVSNIRV